VAPSVAVKVQAPLPVRRCVAWSSFTEAAQTTRPLWIGPSSVSTKNGPASVPTSMSCVSAARTIEPLAAATAKALKVCGSSWAADGTAAATRAASRPERIVFLMISPLT